MEKKYDYQDRLISFAGDIILLTKALPKDSAGRYLSDQIVRSSGSSALNFAETQGASSSKDYLHKASIVLKELKETDVNLKIMRHVNYGGEERDRLQQECIELIKIIRTIIRNRKAQT